MQPSRLHFVFQLKSNFYDKGAPTAKSQRWWGSPCAGFKAGFGPNDGAGAEGVVVAGTGFGFKIDGVEGCATFCVGALSIGAPTAISQRWYGCPCSGFKAGFPDVERLVTDDATSAGAGVVTFAVLSIAIESTFGVSVSATLFFALSQEYNNVTPAIRIFIVFNALIFIKIKILFWT